MPVFIGLLMLLGIVAKNSILVIDFALEEMDKGIGQILDTVKTSGLADHTLVFFFSDNGAISSGGSNKPFRGGKFSPFEGGHRVPAIVHPPQPVADDVTDLVSVSGVVGHSGRIR